MTNYPKKILFAILNWGLGHASRCIPLIHKWLELNVEIIIASDGQALALLKKEFPKLTFYQLPSYHIKYPFSTMELNLLFLAPSFFRAIIAEHHLLKTIVKKEAIQLIFSDNRYGCYQRNIPSVLITHQLHLKSAFPLSQWIANRMQRVLFNRFDLLWIPDYPDPPGLAGQLSHPPLNNPTCRYLGPLSRLWKLNTTQQYDITAILSGPEPQRTILEKKLYQQMQHIPGNHALVRGLPDGGHNPPLPASAVQIFSFLTTTQLNTLIQASGIIVSRSGYSTVMDLAKLNKQAILIPTPGQSEQEYLAKQLERSRQFHCTRQDNFNLAKALKKVQNYEVPCYTLHTKENYLEKAITDLIDTFN